MGRLNYTNRKIDGLKLGQVVNKDLIKRIPPNTGCKAAFRDPAVELDVSGKALKDEGFFEIASALVEALAYDGAQGKCARLEELCLKDNQLTVASLQALTPLVELASNDIRDLDLSSNNITINTEDEVVIWESFLVSFGRCCTLRRIDWSGNALGPRAFEVLLRVYAKERPVDLNLPEDFEQTQDEVPSPSAAHGVFTQRLRKMSIVPSFNDCSDEDECLHSGSTRKGSRQDSKSPEKGNAIATQAGMLPLYATTRGLRSVPYLVLCNTEMTETCALHLSYIVESHRTLQQLVARVPQIKAGPLAQQLIAYDDELHCQGIVYRPNANLSNTGTRVLELAEVRRELNFRDTDEADFEAPAKSTESGKSPRGSSAAGFRPANVTRAKRRQPVHIRSFDQGEEGFDLDRARTRIQGNALQEAGPLSNELWRAALKLLVLGRDIQAPKKLVPPQPPLASSGTVASETPKARGPIIKTLTIPDYVKPQPLKPLIPLMMEKDPNQPLNPWNHNLRKKSDSILYLPHVTNPIHARPEPEQGLCKIKTAEEESVQMNKEYRSQLPCGFSDDAWRRILGHYAGINGILSADQQLLVLRYAIDRGTLSKESEVLGLSFATQIWRILEATGCLTYEMDI